MSVTQKPKRVVKKKVPEEKVIDDQEPKQPVMIKQYTILTDCILAGDPMFEGGIKLVKGKLTRAEAESLNIDFEWLLKSNQIEDRNEYVFA